MKYGTFLFSKNFWMRWCPPSSRAMKLDPLPWSNEVQNTNNPTNTALYALIFYTGTNWPHCNTKRTNSSYVQYTQRPSCIRKVHKTYILSSLKNSPEFVGIIKGIATVHKEMYIDIIRRCGDAIRRKSPPKWRTSNRFLFHDNAPAHRSVLVKDFFAKNNVTTLENRPYSLDLVAANFDLFPPLKSEL